MKKIAVVSCYFQKNYGSALQAYATQRILDDLGVENVTIRYDGLKGEIDKKKYGFYFKKLLNPEIVIGKIGYVKIRFIKKIKWSKLGKKLRERDYCIKEFERTFRLSPKIDNFDELTEYTKDFDAVLVGSDQLWLPSNLDADYYTLRWVPKNVKKISYATSFGVSELPEDYYSLVRDFIGDIDYLSVREESGKNIIKKVCGKEANIICDPTLLFNAEEWLEIQEKEPIVGEPYIFCYFLGDNPDQRQFVQRIKRITGYKIVAILHLNVYVRSDEKYADYTPYKIDSAGFLNLIRNAEIVCTDSFHASVFSIIYHKKFFTFRRFKENYSLQTNSRLDSLLSYLDLMERLTNADSSVEESLNMNIDYNSVDEKIKALRRENINFLKKALEV